MTDSYNHLVDKHLANIAMDIEINQYIDEDMLPPNPQLPSCYPQYNLDLKAGTLYYYNKLLEEKKKDDDTIKKLLESIRKGDTECTLPNGTVVHLPDHDWKDIQELDEATQKLVKTQVTRILNQTAEHITKSKGDLPGEMTLLLSKLNELEPPKFDWKGYLKRFVGKSVKVYTKKSRRKYNKRTPDFPGLKIKQQKHVLVGIDTSASVNNAELKEFLQEIYHMHKTGSEITIIQCDTAISKISKFNPNEDLEIHGRGGKFCATLYGNV